MEMLGSDSIFSSIAMEQNKTRISKFKKSLELFRGWRWIGSVFAFFVFIFILSVVVLYKIIYFSHAEGFSLWYVYSFLAGIFLVSRLPLSFLHDDADAHSHEHIEKYEYPDVSIIIAAKNEEDSIYKTIEACMSSRYLGNMECIVIDDGSTDKTFSEMQRASEHWKNRVFAVSLGVNKGKREAMAEGVTRAKNKILVFVDSDSFLSPTALETLVQHFSDEKVGAVSGNTGVSNHCSNILTKMQSIRYAISYDIFKSSESLFGVVTCCPGCFSAYRKAAIVPILSSWRNQMFLGTRSTFGDDRSLTNFVLKDWRVVYCESAKAVTIVPEKYLKFLRQQLRWKKSWVREGFVSSSFMWKKHPIAAISFYVNLILPTLGPIVVGWVIYMTIFHYNPFFLITFLLGVITMGLLFGAYLYILQKEKYWLYMPLFSIFYTVVMIWQMPYAILTLKKTHWGTR